MLLFSFLILNPRASRTSLYHFCCAAIFLDLEKAMKYEKATRPNPPMMLPSVTGIRFFAKNDKYDGPPFIAANGMMYMLAYGGVGVGVGVLGRRNGD